MSKRNYSLGAANANCPAAFKNADQLSLRKFLECPICHDVVRPPVHTCRDNEHMICECCLRQAPRGLCPICSTPIYNERSIVAEQCMDGITLQCKYQQDGCDCSVKATAYRCHISTCPYREIHCFMAQCGHQIVPFKEFFNHLKVYHAEKVNGVENMTAHTIEWWIEEGCSETARWPPYYFTCFNNVFLYTAIRTEHGMWEWASILADDREAARFEVIASISNNGMSSDLQWRGPVHSIRKSYHTIAESGQCFITNSKGVKNTFIFQKRDTPRRYWRTAVEIVQIAPPYPDSKPYLITTETSATEDQQQQQMDQPSSELIQSLITPSVDQMTPGQVGDEGSELQNVLGEEGAAELENLLAGRTPSQIQAMLEGEDAARLEELLGEAAVADLQNLLAGRPTPELEKVLGERGLAELQNMVDGLFEEVSNEDFENSEEWTSPFDEEAQGSGEYQNEGEIAYEEPPYEEDALEKQNSSEFEPPVDGDDELKYQEEPMEEYTDQYQSDLEESTPSIEEVIQNGINQLASQAEITEEMQFQDDITDESGFEYQNQDEEPSYAEEVAEEYINQEESVATLEKQPSLLDENIARVESEERAHAEAMQEEVHGTVSESCTIELHNLLKGRKASEILKLLRDNGVPEIYKILKRKDTPTLLETEETVNELNSRMQIQKSSINTMGPSQSNSVAQIQKSSMPANQNYSMAGIPNNSVAQIQSSRAAANQNYSVAQIQKSVAPNQNYSMAGIPNNSVVQIPNNSVAQIQSSRAAANQNYSVAQIQKSVAPNQNYSVAGIPNSSVAQIPNYSMAQIQSSKVAPSQNYSVAQIQKSMAPNQNYSVAQIQNNPATSRGSSAAEDEMLLTLIRQALAQAEVAASTASQAAEASRASVDAIAAVAALVEKLGRNSQGKKGRSRSADPYVQSSMQVTAGRRRSTGNVRKRSRNSDEYS